MKRYSQYKPSLNRFLETIPSHWEEKPIKAYCKIKCIQNVRSEELLSVFLNCGVVRYCETDQQQVHKPSEDLSKYQLVEPGDLVLNNQQAWRGSVGVSKYRGIVSPAYFVLSVDPYLNPQFVNYMVRFGACVPQFVIASKGVGSIQRILNTGKLLNSFFSIPPRSEQDQIVRYLDWQVSRIDKLIEGKKKEIELLRERLLCSKNELVLRGISKNLFVDSGIDWYGNVPITWRFSKIRRHFLIRKRIAGQEGYTVLSITQRGLKAKDLSTNEGQMAQDYSGYQFVYPGDFAMNGMDLICGYIDISKQTGVTSPDYRVFTLEDNETCYSEYYLEFFRLCYKRRIFYRYGRGAANQGRWRLNATNFNNFTIPVPPYKEQVEIAKRIRELENLHEKAVEGIEKQIELLQEFKTRLISDVVTGKMDVRNFNNFIE